MSLFGALYIGDSGLRASQNALNTVAHNLSNINTPGYVRQQVSQSTQIEQTSPIKACLYYWLCIRHLIQSV